MNNLIANLSLRQVTMTITVLLTILNGLVLYLTLTWTDRIWVVFLVLIALMVIGFILVNYFLRKNVFRKLKVIYKIIRSSKQSKEEKVTAANVEDYTLDSVNQQVLDWATNTQAEIKNLKTLETYRKDFVGNISHELKTPIFNMQGYLHTLLDGAIHDDNINMKYLKKATSNLERLQSIVEDLESISRLESEADAVDVSKFGIKDLVEDVISELELISRSNNHVIEVKEQASRNFQVMADPNMIRQVLVNLLTNSVKYNQAEAGHTMISFYDLDRQILVEISDNGIGIEEKHLKHLFDRFYRVDTSRSRTLGGSGLGLSIVKHIIEAHNQTINVRSTPGVGSTFGFTLQKAG